MGISEKGLMGVKGVKGGSASLKSGRGKRARGDQLAFGLLGHWSL